jgi:deazaflavin-dependent oxidoreductase (nitroreductase family)
MPANTADPFVYLTTTGRKTGLPREIEIWFVERDGLVYIMAEHGHKAHWVRNILVNSAATVRLRGVSWPATGRVLSEQTDADLYNAVRDWFQEKYGWGDGLPVEFRPAAG